MLLAQLMSCLCRAVKVLCAFTWLFADHSNFVFLLQGKMLEVDALFVVPWDTWKKQIACEPVHLQMAPDEFEDGMGEDDLPDQPSLDELTTGKHPPKKRKHTKRERE